MIRTYYVVSEDGTRWGAFLEQEEAQEWSDAANIGGCIRKGWKGEQFKVVYADCDYSESSFTWNY